MFAGSIIDLAYWGVSWGSGGETLKNTITAEDLGGAAGFGIAAIRFWNAVAMTLASGFIFSYFWTWSTVIYFLLRRKVNATELDEVYMPEDRELHSLPPLKTGPDGVAEVA